MFSMLCYVTDTRHKIFEIISPDKPFMKIHADSLGLHRNAEVFVKARYHCLHLTEMNATHDPSLLNRWLAELTCTQTGCY